jgi:hypothetical protein
MVRSLFASSSPDLASFLANIDANSTDEVTLDWLRLRDDLSNVPIDSVTAAAVKQWLPAVSRFSFRPGLVVAADELATAAAKSAEDPASPLAATRLNSAPARAGADQPKR